MEPGSVISLRTRLLGTACEVRLSLICFSPDPAHVPLLELNANILFERTHSEKYKLVIMCLL